MMRYYYDAATFPRPLSLDYYLYLCSVSVAVATTEEPVRETYGGGARHSLCFDGYDFAIGELDAVLYFLTLQAPKLR